MDTVQCVSNSLKFLSFALTSMHRLDAVKKLVAAAAIAAGRVLGAEHNRRLPREKVKKVQFSAVKYNNFTADFLYQSAPCHPNFRKINIGEAETEGLLHGFTSLHRLLCFLTSL